MPDLRPVQEVQEKIVYFLGAGFSAPLGLPVMSDFLLRSKDLYFGNPESFKHFDKVLQTIERMGKAKNYYTLDLFNIEEVLSILEMEDYIGSESGMREAYRQYLRDVIMSLTPSFDSRDERSTWPGFMPTHSQLGSDYAAFAAALFRLTWERVDNRYFATTQSSERPRYGVITLNYDLVLENSLNLLLHSVGPSQPLRFAVNREDAKDPNSVPLAKLHGSVEPLTIIAPTWNKVANEEVVESWRLAYHLLKEATQVRFVGYSLPSSDTYVRYLLASAALEAQHLKRLDCICLDPSGDVERRFRSLIGYFKFRFKSIDTASYLSEHRRLIQATSRTASGDIRRFDRLEEAHGHLMSSG